MSVRQAIFSSEVDILIVKVDHDEHASCNELPKQTVLSRDRIRSRIMFATKRSFGCLWHNVPVREVAAHDEFAPYFDPRIVSPRPVSGRCSGE